MNALRGEASFIHCSSPAYNTSVFILFSQLCELFEAFLKTITTFKVSEGYCLQLSLTQFLLFFPFPNPILLGVLWKSSIKEPLSLQGRLCCSNASGGRRNYLSRIVCCTSSPIYIPTMIYQTFLPSAKTSKLSSDHCRPSRVPAPGANHLAA